MTSTTITSARSSRIVRVYWSVPGVAEGATRTIRAAEEEIRNVRSRVGPIHGHLVVCRADDSRERVPA